MNRRVIAIVLIIALVLVVGGGAFLIGRGTAGSTSEAPDRPSWLFSQTADSGTVTPNDDGTYTLTLRDVDPNVIAFTDRPDRQSAVGSVGKLVEHWPELFKESAPNGVLVAHNAAGETNSAVVELADPRLDGTTLEFTVNVLTNEAGTASPGASYDFEKASLFIDDVQAYYICMSPNLEQVIDPPGMYQAIPSKLELAAFEKTCQANGGLVNLV